MRRISPMSCLKKSALKQKEDARFSNCSAKAGETLRHSGYVKRRNQYQKKYLFTLLHVIVAGFWNQRTGFFSHFIPETKKTWRLKFRPLSVQYKHLLFSGCYLQSASSFSFPKNKKFDQKSRVVHVLAINNILHWITQWEALLQSWTLHQTQFLSEMYHWCQFSGASGEPMTQVHACRIRYAHNREYSLSPYE